MPHRAEPRKERDATGVVPFDGIEADALCLRGAFRPCDWADAEGIALALERPPAPAAASDAATRAAELREIAGLYLSGSLGPQMHAAAEDLLVAGLDDPSPKVRLALAEAIAAHPKAPRAVVLGLAQDSAPIAAVIVARTPCLLDVELLEIARTATAPVLGALASRPDIPRTLVARLVVRADASLAQLLAENHRLALLGDDLDRLVEGFGAEPAVRDALLARPDLPALARLRLVDLASERLAGGLKAFGGP